MSSQADQLRGPNVVTEPQPLLQSRQRPGVAEPTIYAVFGSKKGLLLALRQQMHAEVELPRLTAEAKGRRMRDGS